MDHNEYLDSTRILPQNFDFDEEFDQDCFEEDIGENIPQYLVP